MRPAELEHALAEPRRDVLERFVPHSLDARAFDVWVVVAHVDELRAALVRPRGDGSGKLLLAEVGRKVDDLPRLHVRAEVDDQLR